jgi:hypothetical protein
MTKTRIGKPRGATLTRRMLFPLLDAWHKTYGEAGVLLADLVADLQRPPVVRHAA